jgi:ketosteroid isomerase-like protein
MAAWIEKLYQAMDAGDAEVISAHFEDNFYSQFGSFKPTRGAEEANATYAKLVPGVTSIQHVVQHMWDVEEGTTVTEFEVTYTKGSGEAVVLPATTILRYHGEKVYDIRVYMDITPVAAD